MRKIKHPTTAVALLLAVQCTAGFAQQNASSLAGPASPIQPQFGVIGPDDNVTILALNAEEISRDWRVNSSGDISLPMIGTIRAAGMTTTQLEAEIRTRLEKYVRQPQVSVHVSQYRSQPVTISGSVEKPGIVQLQGPTALFEVIAGAGGPRNAGPTLTLTRNKSHGPIPHPDAKESIDGKSMVLTLPLNEVMRGYGESATIKVYANDFITVSGERRQRFVYVSGEVTRPGAIELITQDTVSLTKAIAIAGGITRTASAGKTMIRHINNEGIETAIAFIDLNKVLSGKVKDLTLAEGDVIIVPSNKILSYIQTVSLSAMNAGFLVLARL